MSSDTRYEMVIERRENWGQMKWHGNVLYHSDGEFGHITLAESQGWFSWSRKRLERRLRRHIAKEKRRSTWEAARDRIPVESP